MCSLKLIDKMAEPLCDDDNDVCTLTQNLCCSSCCIGSCHLTWLQLPGAAQRSTAFLTPAMASAAEAAVVSEEPLPAAGAVG